MKDYYDILRKVYFFQDLSENDLENIANSCHQDVFEDGQIIFKEGDEAEKFYIVIEGNVEVWKDYPSKDQDKLAELNKGQIFGEMALIDDLPRSATVVSKGKTTVLFHFKKDFHSIIENNAKIAISILKSISSTVRKSNETFVMGLRKRNEELEKANKELKETQEELIKAERLSTLGKFSSVIFHDIRNPITVVKGAAELILHNVKNTERIEKYAGKIIQESLRMNTMSQEILDYSRGDIRLQLQPVVLGDFFNKIKQTMQEKYSGRNLDITVDVQVEHPIVIDLDRMLRAFLNLADNAVKAIKKDGCICLSARHEKQGFVLSVKDSGEGMSTDVLIHIFEPFYSSSKRGGTGLGMIAVRNIIEAHNGIIEVKSEINKGTEVIVILPELKK